MDLTATFLKNVSEHMRAGGLTPAVLAQAVAELLPVDAAGISTLFEILRLPLGASSRPATMAEGRRTVDDLYG